MGTETRERILKQFKRDRRLTSVQLARRLKISRQAAHRHLRELTREGKILKQGTSRKTTFYILNDPSTLKRLWKGWPTFKKRYKRERLDEEAVYREAQLQPYLLSDLRENVRTLFHYAFTEILNNAIDHSGSHFVDVTIQSNPQTISFATADYGIGIFENIRSKKGLATEMEALQDLLKGKQTTQPSYHSGEGVFFTSKVADRFRIESHKKTLLIENRIQDMFVKDIRFQKGTSVNFELDKDSQKKLEEIFRSYTNEEFQFDKSHVTVKLFQEGEEYISRSQAKRLLHALEPFSEITLDFQGVSTVGQAFADEVFRVFSSQHPGVKVTPINCHENVRFMIERVRAGQPSTP